MSFMVLPYTKWMERLTDGWSNSSMEKNFCILVVICYLHSGLLPMKYHVN